MQEAATPTYVISDEVATLLKNDPNILDKAKNALAKRYTSDASVELRKDYINSIINKNDNADDNVVLEERGTQYDSGEWKISRRYVTEYENNVKKSYTRKL